VRERECVCVRGKKEKRKQGFKVRTVGDLGSASRSFTRFCTILRCSFKRARAKEQERRERERERGMRD